jgi:hypothetical protein
MKKDVLTATMMETPHYVASIVAPREITPGMTRG